MYVTEDGLDLRVGKALVIVMMNVIEIAKKELDNKVDETVALIEHKIAEVIKSSQPSTIDIASEDIGVYNPKMFSRICEKVAEQAPEGIKVFMVVLPDTDVIRVKADFKELF